MSDQPTDALLGRIRALLAKAEDPAATPAEAEVFTSKATELMAKYGIEQALLGDRVPNSDKPEDRVIAVDNPWGREKARLLYWLADAMRCRPLLLSDGDGAARVHVFGFDSDIQRVELLFTSILLQMTNALAKAKVPSWEKPRPYRRSWLIGFTDEVVERVKAAEARAAAQGESAPAEGGRSTALVLADRKAIIQQKFAEQYPRTRSGRTRYSGSGAGAGRAAGRTANIGQTGLNGRRRAIGGAQ
ncbi:DUF2786 domain-containing protein [Streptomyces sp. NPDC048696]|uniref:DUF2786 domain-containing protein n=1 Tax=Streptomyces sp. NPDC048696 TaxID=3365585 RepID=UPI003711EDA5